MYAGEVTCVLKSRLSKVLSFVPDVYSSLNVCVTFTGLDSSEHDEQKEGICDSLIFEARGKQACCAFYFTVFYVS